MAMKDALVREARPAEVTASPIVEGSTTVPDHPLNKREISGYVFWGILGAFILTTEALAAFSSGFPIPTLSWTTGQLEMHHTWFKLIVVGGLVSIAFRITFYPWPFRKLDD